MTSKSAHSRRILVVEDVQETRNSLVELLVTDGYLVDAAQDAQEGEKLAKDLLPDLILLLLPGTTEERTAVGTRIRERGQLGRKTPIVIFSVDTIPEGADWELPKNVFLARPDNFNQLRALLARVLSDGCLRH